MGEIAKKSTEFSAMANEVMRFAEQIKNAGEFIPANFRGNAGAIAAAVLTGRELGLGPMASLRGLYVAQGKVGMFYDVMIGLLRKHGYRIDWEKTTSEEAAIKITHADGSSITVNYSKSDAVTAGLWNGATWKKHPATMLRARCVSNAARAFAGDIFSGIYSVDEIDEIKDKEEKPINTIKVNSGVAELEERMSNKSENLESKENSEKPNVIDEGVIMGVTDYDLILDEIESAGTGEALSICVNKITKSESIGEDEKGRLRTAYQEKQKEIENGRVKI